MREQCRLRADNSFGRQGFGRAISQLPVGWQVTRWHHDDMPIAADAMPWPIRFHRPALYTR